MLACGCTPTVGLATGFVAFFPVLRSPVGSDWPGSCGFSSPLWFSTFAMGSPLRGRGWFLLDRNEGLACFSFPFRMFLRVPTVLRIGSPYASNVLVGSHLYAHSGCQCLTLSLQARFLVVLAGVECLRMFLALSSVLPFPLLWFHVGLHSHCFRTWFVLGAFPSILPDRVRPSV